MALIALTRDGQGGNIIIDGDVTDIEASLIAEKGIVGSGAKDKQLYIHGSLISANTYNPMDEEGNITQSCPYFTTQECDQYNIMQLRSDYVDARNFGAQSSAARNSRFTPVVVEQDFRVQRDPPPGLVPVE